MDTLANSTLMVRSPEDISDRSRTQKHEYFRVITEGEGLACSGQLSSGPLSSGREGEEAPSRS